MAQLQQPAQTIHEGIPYPGTKAYEERMQNIPRLPPNYTPPNDPSFIDIFKGNDYDDGFRKMLLMTKYTTGTAIACTVTDVLVGTQPTDVAGILRRAAYWSVPLIGGGLAYTATVCIAGSLRKKSDQWNHALGGAIAGSVLGAARKNALTGFVTGAFLVVLGVVYKETVMDGQELWSNPRQARRGYAMSHKHDFTMQRDIPGNWYTDPTPQPRSPAS